MVDGHAACARREERETSAAARLRLGCVSAASRLRLGCVSAALIARRPSHAPSFSSPCSLMTAGCTPKKGRIAQPGFIEAPTRQRLGSARVSRGLAASSPLAALDRQRHDHDAARLRLPPRVNDRAARAADLFVVPAPRLRVDWLAHLTRNSPLVSHSLTLPAAARLPLPSRAA